MATTITAGAQTSPSGVRGPSRVGGRIPVGAIVDFAGGAVPKGWLLCFGQAVSRTTYVELFNQISTYWGTGNGSTTFNVPDLRGRICVGLDNMGGTSADRLTSALNGDVLGAAGGSEYHTLTLSEIPAHYHSDVQVVNQAGNYWAIPSGGTLQNWTVYHAQGGDAAHNNTQPTAITLKIILAGV